MIKLTSTLLLVFAFAVNAALGANSLLKEPTQGTPYSQGRIDNMEMISNGTDAALVCYNKTTGEFYIVDIADNDANDASENKITEINNLGGVLAGATGQTGLTLRDIQVNPISKSVYLLVHTSSESYIVKLERNGEQATLIEMKDISYSKLAWGGSGQFAVQDMTWGNNTLFIASGSSFALDGELAWAEAPFANNATTDNRATTMFKTNWGGKYFTDAPLEKLDFAIINDEPRLMGVTLCAPGFSLKVSDLTTGSGVLEVTEDFNVRYNAPIKVVHVEQSGQHYLFNLHSDGQLMRIGQKFLDGSQVSLNKHNQNVTYLRTPSGSATSGLAEADFKILSTSYTFIAHYDNNNLLVMEGQALKLLSIADGNVGTHNPQQSPAFSFYPNPAHSVLKLQSTGELKGATLKILSLDGRLVQELKVNGSAIEINTESLDPGSYILSLSDADEREVYRSVHAFQ